MKLTSASITITAAAIVLRTNGVMAASIVDRHVKSMTATNLFPGVHYGIEVDASKKSWGEVVFTKTDRFIGSAWVGNPFLREMQEFVGVYPPDSLSGDDSQEMMITHLMKTSQWHTDGLGIGDGAAQGFYVLSDNPHAYFETNHDELCIPIVKGDFITFNGRMLHRTVIANGFVDLLGPFDLHSLKRVGRDPFFVYGATVSEMGDAKGRQDGERQLGEKTGTEKLISGQVFRVIDFDCGANEIKEHHIVYDVTGLGNCPNCKMSIAFSNAQECTKETLDEARMIPLLSDLTYTTDDEGNTGVKYTNFIVDGEHPTGKQFLSYAKNLFDDPAQVQEWNFSVFFYDDKGELVACSFLHPILSDEDEESAAEILAIIAAEVELENNITADSISSEIEDALNNNGGNEATPIGIDDGGNNAGSLMFSFLSIVVSAAACVFLS